MGNCGCFDFRVKKKFLNEKEINENIIKEPLILKPLNDLQQTRNEKNLNKKIINAIINDDEKATDNIIVVINNKINEKEKLRTDESLISINTPIHNIKNINKENLFELKGKKEINIVIIGEKQSGKSSFAIYISELRFESIYIPTVYIEKVSKILTYNNNKYILNFFVTPGVQEYKEDYSSLYKKANFILLFYDISIKGSFKQVKKIIKKDLKNLIVIYPNNFSNTIIVGNKIDKCDYEKINPKGRKYCEKNNLQYFEISVKTKIGVGYMINKILSVFEHISS